nr:glycosyltransferase family 1 protein [Novosphingobium sp. FKTRR1]
MPSQYGGRHSGVAKVAFALLERLLERGDHTYVLRSNWSRAQLPAGLQTDALKLVEVPRPRKMATDVMLQCWTVPRLCRKLGIDVVWNIDMFGSALGGKARVTTIHDLYFHTHPEMFPRNSVLTMAICARMMIGGSARLAAISAQTRKDLVSFVPAAAKRSQVIYNDTTLAADAPPPREIAENYILLVGNATPNKNFGVVVAALHRLAEHPARPVLVHVGKDDAGMISGALASCGSNPPKVISPDNVDDQRLAGLYAHAACLAVPSLAEGFCLPVVEAQALGCPVVAARASVLPEVAGDAALFFDPHEPEELAACLGRLLDSPELADELRKRGLANRNRFDWQKSAADYAALFAELGGPGK